MFIILLLVAAPKLKGAKLKRRNEIMNYGTSTCCNVVYSLKFIVMKTTRPHGSCACPPTLTTCVCVGGVEKGGGGEEEEGSRMWPCCLQRQSLEHVLCLPSHI